MRERDIYLPDDNFENWKSHVSCLWCQKLKQSVLLVSGKLTTWGSFLLKIKIEQNRKLDSFLFQGENNFKKFKNC